MEDEIEDLIQIKFNKKIIKITVEYENIRTYKITIKAKNLPLERGILTKTIIFSYDWLNNFTFDSNINQLYYEITNLLKKEGITNYEKFK